MEDNLEDAKMSSTTVTLCVIILLVAALAYAQHQGYPVLQSLRSFLAACRNLIPQISRKVDGTGSKRSHSNVDEDAECGKLLAVRDLQMGSVGIEVAVSDGSGGAIVPRPGPSFASAPVGYQPLLSIEDARQVAMHLPSRVVGRDLALLFSTRLHGYALRTLWSRVRGKGPSLVCVMDDAGSVFGGFASRDWSGTDLVTGSAVASDDMSRGGARGSEGVQFGSPSSGPSGHWARGSVGYMGPPSLRGAGSAGSYFGSGESFLFTTRPSFAVYRWTRKNNLFLLANEECLAFGGGGLGFGLLLDGELERGTSTDSDTYGNACLAASPAFKVVQVEVWGFAAPKAGGPLALGSVPGASAVAHLRSQMSAAARNVLMRQTAGGRPVAGLVASLHS